MIIFHTSFAATQTLKNSDLEDTFTIFALPQPRGNGLDDAAHRHSFQGQQLQQVPTLPQRQPAASRHFLPLDVSKLLRNATARPRSFAYMRTFEVNPHNWILQDPRVCDVSPAS